MHVPKTPEYLKPPEHQVNADEFVQAVGSTVMSQYDDLFIVADNITRDLVDYRDVSKKFEHIIGRAAKASLRASDEADRESAFLNEVVVHIHGNDESRVRSARTEVDRLARTHLGEKRPEIGQIEEDKEASGEDVYDSKWNSHNYYIFSFRN